MTEFERKRHIIRKNFRSKYLGFNLHFINILFVLTMRVGIYIGLRFVSREKLFEWTFIKPSVFYLTYFTDICIVAGVMIFLMSSTTLKSMYQKTGDSATD